MDPSILERLGMRPQRGPENRERTERAVAARTLMYVFLVGAVVAAGALLSPVSGQIDSLRVASTAGCAVLMAAVLFAGYDRLPSWCLTVLLLCGSMLIEWAIYASGDPTSPFLLFYVWIAFYAFYFFGRLQAAMQAAFIGIAYAVVLAHSIQPLHVQLVRWLVFMVAIVVSGLLVRAMRERIDTLRRTVADTSRRDGLTGLLDERGFDEILHKELERARRSGNRVGVVLAELDGRGSARDRLGGRRADEVLAAVGGKLGGTIRLNDEGARIEDERFAVVCPYTDEKGAAIMAERIGSLVRELYAADQRYTVSFGVASYPKHGASAEAIMHAVRHALGEASELGGDRAVTFFSAENSIEERLRSAEIDIEVVAEPRDAATA